MWGRLPVRRHGYGKYMHGPAASRRGAALARNGWNGYRKETGQCWVHRPAGAAPRVLSFSAEKLKVFAPGEWRVPQGRLFYLPTNRRTMSATATPASTLAATFHRNCTIGVTSFRRAAPRHSDHSAGCSRKAAFGISRPRLSVPILMPCPWRARNPRRPLSNAR